MRQPQNAKRGRGRGRRGNGNAQTSVPNRNASYESNGPDVKLRGNAQQLNEKYLALAHDAAAAGYGFNEDERQKVFEVKKKL